MARSRVSGYRQTAGNLRELTSLVATPANEASRYALRPIVAESRRNLKVMGINRTGELSRSLTVKRDRDSSRVRPVHLVGPDAASPAVRYAHLVELGTAPHENKGEFAGTQHPGTPPRPFLRSAYEAVKEEVVRRFGERIGPAIEKQAAKLAAKARAR